MAKTTGPPTHIDGEHHYARMEEDNKWYVRTKDGDHYCELVGSFFTPDNGVGIVTGRLQFWEQNAARFVQQGRDEKEAEINTMGDTIMEDCIAYEQSVQFCRPEIVEGVPNTQTVLIDGPHHSGRGDTLVEAMKDATR